MAKATDKETETAQSELTREGSRQEAEPRRGRLEVGARSRSRGRTPAELLARKQQLLNGGAPSSPRSTTANRRQQEEDFFDAHGEESSNSSGSNGAQAGQLSAEARLESLSVLLKNHQVSSSQEQELDSPQQLADPTSSNGTQNGHEQQAGQQQQQQQQLKSLDDVYILLAKKEKDLQLAAELGKVLLERNEELSRANEKIAEEYSHKLELLEQEKHKLRRKLDQLDGEYENRIIELQTDCNILKNKLEQQQQSEKQAEREKSKLVNDLVLQNQRLTNELAEATKSEELLSSQLEQVNERLGSRLSNRSDHAAQVDALQEEIHILSQRKQDLERRLKLAQAEKQHLSESLDECDNKVLLFENLLNEKELRIGELALEINELRDSSAWLSSKLESMISLNERLVDCIGPDDESTRNGKNLNNDEHDHHRAHNFDDDLKTISERDRSQLVEQLKELRLKRNSRMKANEMILLDANERRRKSLLFSAQAGGGHRTHQQVARRRRAALGRRKGGSAATTNLQDGELGERTSSDGSLSLSEDEAQQVVRSRLCANPKEGATAGGCGGPELSDLIGEIYSILNNFLASLEQRRESLARVSASGAKVSSQRRQQVANEDSGVGSADEQTQNQRSIMSTDESGHHSAGSAGSVSPPVAGDADEQPPVGDLARWRQLIESLKNLIDELPCSSCQLMIIERAEFEKLKRTHARVCDELKMKSDENLRLSGENIEQVARLGVLEDKCKLLTGDLENCDKPKEEIVALAWKTRDEAVARKNNAEIQLAKTRIENMQISSQLMEVVQQKGQLSQKLAQFEDDIHYMMQRSVRARFTWEEYAEETRRLGRRTGGKFTTTLSNLVPSPSQLTATSNGQQQQQQQQQQSSSSIGQQLLSLTGVNLLSPTRRRLQQHLAAHQATATSTGDALDASMTSGEMNNAGSMPSAQQVASAPASSTSTSANILTSLKLTAANSSKFNLRFWQKGTQQRQQQEQPEQDEAKRVGSVA